MLINIFLIILTAFIFALLIESPLIYARLKNKNSWVPVNSPPWMLGDDYYYYSILNELHKKFFNKKLKTSSLSIFIAFQYFGYLINLIPYHLGYLIEDKRLGVLFVKLWNRAFLFVSILICSQQVQYLLDYKFSFEKLIVIFLLYFFFYPGPISLLSIRNGIAFNVFNPKHMFNMAHTNDLTRGMHSETTAPLLLMLTGLTLNALSQNPEYLHFYILVFSLILFFQYFPAFVVYSSFCLLLLIFLNQFILALILAALYFFLSLFYLKILSKCGVFSELFADINY